MKSRIKKFFKENEVQFVGAAYVVTAIVVASLATRKMIEGMQINDVLRRTYEDGGMDLAIALKNGQVQNFHWLPAGQ